MSDVLLYIISIVSPLVNILKHYIYHYQRILTQLHMNLRELLYTSIDI